MPSEPGPILLADHVAGALFRKVWELDLEGIVAKRMTAPYREKTLSVKVRNPCYSQKEGRSGLFKDRWR